MKEKDFEKCLDNIIIDGLIKEAEQDNADFENAMSRISDEKFNEIVRQPEYADGYNDDAGYAAAAGPCYCKVAYDNDIEKSARKHKSFKICNWNVIRPWIVSAVSAAAVILAVIVPSVNAMNSRLCESALYASEAYITPAKGGFDLSTASPDEIKRELPQLKARYDSSILTDGKYDLYLEDFDEAGWNLAVAYLKLHKKREAVKVLKKLSENAHVAELRIHCAELLKQLD